MGLVAGLVLEHHKAEAGMQHDWLAAGEQGRVVMTPHSPESWCKRESRCGLCNRVPATSGYILLRCWGCFLHDTTSL